MHCSALRLSDMLCHLVSLELQETVRPKRARSDN